MSSPALLVHLASGVGNLVFATPLLVALERLGYDVDLFLHADYPQSAELFAGWSAVRRVIAGRALPSTHRYDALVPAVPPFYWSGSRRLYEGRRSVLARPPEALFWRNEQRWYLGFAEQLGWPADSHPVYRLPVAPSDEYGVTARTLVLAPGCKGGEMAAKRWPHFAALAERFDDVAVVGTDDDLLAWNDAPLRFPAHVRSFVGRLSLRQTAELMAGAGAVVANDSGLGHVAAATGAPTVLLFGPTPDATLGPAAPNATVLRAGLPCEPCWFTTAKLRACARRVDCLHSLTVDAVEREVRRLLGLPLAPSASTEVRPLISLASPTSPHATNRTASSEDAHQSSAPAPRTTERTASSEDAHQPSASAHRATNRTTSSEDAHQPSVSVHRATDRTALSEDAHQSSASAHRTTDRTASSEDAHRPAVSGATPIVTVSDRSIPPIPSVDRPHASVDADIDVDADRDSERRADGDAERDEGSKRDGDSARGRDADADAPLVSCLMPTRDRRTYVQRAIRHFLRQTYSNRELVVVDDGDDCVEDLIPPDPRVRYHRAPRQRSLGTKRNLACSLARGELLAHWDDDDWTADDRIARQTAALLASAEAEMCGLAALRFFDPAARRAWEYRWTDARRPWVAGGTMLFRRRLWERKPFPELNEGEDTRYVWSLPPAAVLNVAAPELYAALVHPGNTSRKRTSGAHWHPLPFHHVQNAMGADWAFYESLAAVPA